MLISIPRCQWVNIITGIDLLNLSLRFDGNIILLRLIQLIATKFCTCHDSSAVMACAKFLLQSHFSGLDIKHLVYMPIRRVVLKIYVPCKIFHVPSQYLYKPCKAYVYCWENKSCPDWKIICQVRHVTAEVDVSWERCKRLNVQPCFWWLTRNQTFVLSDLDRWVQTFLWTSDAVLS